MHDCIANHKKKTCSNRNNSKAINDFKTTSGSNSIPLSNVTNRNNVKDAGSYMACPKQ